MPRMAAFSPQRAEEIRRLLPGATLDVEKRKALAAVLDAALQVGKVALKGVVKRTA